jgi:hypothetical protein
MRIVPVLAVVVIVGILSQSSMSESQVGTDTRAGLRVAGIVLAIASVLYLIRTRLRRSGNSDSLAT